MIRAALALGLAVALPLPGLALSCEPWSPAQAFEMAEAASARYRVVVGTFAVERGAFSLETNGTAQVPATLTGRSLTRAGFAAPYAEHLQLDVSCALDWCGSVIPDQPYLVFVEETDAGARVELGPCATVVFPGPTPAVEREMTRCLTGGRCAPD